MKFCTNCGSQMPDDAKICGNCGSALAAPAQPQQQPVQPQPQPTNTGYVPPTNQHPAYNPPSGTSYNPAQMNGGYAPAQPNPGYAPAQPNPGYAPAAPYGYAPAPGYAPVPVKKKGKGGLIALIAILAIIAVAVALFFTLFYRSSDATLAKQFDAIVDQDVDAYISVINPNRMFNQKEDDFKKECEKALKAQHELFVAEYGDDFEISYEITEEKDWDDDKVDSYNKNVDENNEKIDKGDIKVNDDVMEDSYSTISAGKDVKVKITVSGSKKSDTDTATFKLVKIGFKWYLGA